MGEPILKQFWFVTSTGYTPKTYLIFTAENAEKARKYLDILKMGDEIMKLTWRQLSEFTGCLIPCQCKPTDLANGKLMFMSKGNFITVW